MKRSVISYKFLLLIAGIALATTGCYVDLDDNDGFGIGPAVRGSGRITTEGRTVSSFTRIEIEGSANVFLSQGNDQVVEIEADDNIVPIITTEVRGGELEISSSRNYRTSNPVNIYITIPVIDAVRIDGSGDIFGENSIAGDQLELQVDGSGNMDLELYYDQLLVESNGSGDFQLFGETSDQEVRVTGSGNYQARDLVSENCNIRISGSGDAAVFASGFLKADIRGSGNILYYGSPQLETSVSGSGNVISAR